MTKDDYTDYFNPASRPKRQKLVPFPRVGKRQALIPFPRTGKRASYEARPSDLYISELLRAAKQAENPETAFDTSEVAADPNRAIGIGLSARAAARLKTVA